MNFLTLLTSVCIFCQVAHDWKLHRHESPGFLYYGPAKMEYKSKNIETSAGPVTYHTYYSSDVENNKKITFTVSYYSQPTEEAWVGEALDALIDSSVRSLDGLLEYQDDVTLDGTPGKLWRISLNEGKVKVKSKAFYKNGHYYIFQAIMVEDKAFDSRVDAFLDSVRWTG
ncbi:MAG: hypothetical protein R3275_05605 [Saprospiraceae bacterium]|nr:hypothetical protein [Saprospiraceae bacterium]